MRELSNSSLQTSTNSSKENIDKPSTIRYSSTPASKLSLQQDNKESTTTKLELWAWWIYNFSIEPVALTCIVMLMPFLLLLMPREIGHIRGFPNTSCSSSESEHDVCILFNIGIVQFKNHNNKLLTFCL